MADYVVYGRAYRLGKTVVTHIRWDGLQLFDNVRIAQLVDGIRRNARLDVFGNHPQHVGCQVASPPGHGHFLRRMDGNKLQTHTCLSAAATESFSDVVGRPISFDNSRESSNKAPLAASTSNEGSASGQGAGRPAAVSAAV